MSDFVRRFRCLAPAAVRALTPPPLSFSESDSLETRKEKTKEREKGRFGVEVKQALAILEAVKVSV